MQRSLIFLNLFLETCHALPAETDLLPSLAVERPLAQAHRAPLVVFCVYGFHVGCRTAIALREAGFDAKYMKGGHAGWKATGGATKMFA
jgi:rhodanese-related sulfurtransferase